MELVGVLNEVENAITNKESGILTEINNLMSAPNDKEKQAAVFALIGTVIHLIIGIIKAAVEQPAVQGRSPKELTDGSAAKAPVSNQ